MTGFVVSIMIFVVIVLFSSTTLVDAQLPVTSDREAALEALGRLNEWRLEEGLLPFKMNDTLEDLAFYQADYVRTMRPIPNGSAIHVGRRSEGVAVRALYDQFAWDFYGSRDRIAIAEIAAVNNIDKAIAFWKSSTVHHNTVVNPGYREIGIVALPYSTGHIYLAVLGARPNVLPALVHPETHQLYLGQDLSRYATWPGWVTKPTQYRFFDKDGRPMSSNWLDYAPIVDLPKDAEERVYITYTDGTYQVMSEVDLERDIIVLPGYYPPPDPLLIPLVVSTAVPTATPEPPKPEILLVYDRRSLAIVSQSRTYEDWSSIDLVSDGYILTLDSIAQGMTGAGLYYFPAGDCLMVWSGNAETVSPREPSQCGNMRRGRSNLTAAQRFWIDKEFTVERDGELLATCEPENKTCEIDLP
jgi:uncharacterized protein YkwD